MSTSPFYKIYLDPIQQRDITESVESFRYEDCVNEDSYIELKMFDKNSLELLDDKDFITGKIVLVHFGFLGGLVSPVHRARITDITATYGVNVTMTVKCLDMGTKMKRNTSVKVWKQKTSADIAKEIALRYGLKAEVEDTKKVWPIMQQGNKSDFEFLHSLADKETNGNHVFFVRSDTLYFLRRGLNKKSLFTFTYGKDEDIISFAPAWKESSADSGSITSNVTSFDMVNKVTKMSTVTDKNEKNAVNLGEWKTVYDENGNKVGEQNVNNGQPITGQPKEKNVLGQITDYGKNFIAPFKDTTEADNTGHSHKKKNKIKTLEATLVISGQPLIFPNEVITMDGVATRHKGNWYVHKVSHDISPGSGYITTITLGKNAVKQKTGTSADNVNKSVGAGNAEDKVIISVYDENGNHIGDKTSSGKYIPL